MHRRSAATAATVAAADDRARYSRDDARHLLREQASIFADLGDADRLAPIVALLREKDRRQRDTQYFSAALAFMQGDLDIRARAGAERSSPRIRTKRARTT